MKAACAGRARPNGSPDRISRMMGHTWRTAAVRVVVTMLALAATGCASLVGNATQGLSRSLTSGVLESDDPQTVADGLPAYLILLDGLISNDPLSAGLLLAASRLYGAYAGGFVEEPERRTRLADRSFAYAKRATCVLDEPLCAAIDKPYEEFAATIAQVDDDELDLVYGLGTAWAGVIEANADDFDRIAELPKVEALFHKLTELAPDHDHGSAFMYLGVMSSLRPEALGGNPAVGKAAFEQAIARSQGRNLMAPTLYAQYYARLMFDQELHDKLLNDVLAADPHEPGLTLINVLAQKRAKSLLESGKDYF